MSVFAMRPTRLPSLFTAGDESTSRPDIVLPRGSSWDSPGAWVEVFAALPYPVDAIQARVLASGDGTVVYELGIGPSGYERPICVPMQSTSNVMWHQLPLPIWLPAGTRLVARAITPTLSGVTPYLQVQLYPAIWTSPRGCVDWVQVGHDNWASNTGLSTLILTVGSLTNTKGPFNEVLASAPFAVRRILMRANAPNSGSSTVYHLLDVATGSIGNEVVVVSNVALKRVGAATGQMGMLDIVCDIPAGSRISMRHQSDNSNTNNNPIQAFLAFGG